MTPLFMAVFGFHRLPHIEPHLGAAESPRGSVDGFLNKIAM